MSQTISFTVEEVNQILGVLGEAPAKFTINLIQFIKGKAEEQLGSEQVNSQEVVDVETV